MMIYKPILDLLYTPAQMLALLFNIRKTGRHRRGTLVIRRMRQYHCSRAAASWRSPRRARLSVFQRGLCSLRILKRCPLRMCKFILFPEKRSIVFTPIAKTNVRTDCKNRFVLFKIFESTVNDLEDDAREGSDGTVGEEPAYFGTSSLFVTSSQLLDAVVGRKLQSASL